MVDSIPIMEKIQQLKQFLEKSPNDNFLIHALALEYAKLEMDEEAAHYFETNRQAAPDYLATYFHLGKLYEQMNQPVKAIEVYKEGIDIAQQQQQFKTKNEIALALEMLEDEL